MWIIQKATAMGNWWLAASWQQSAHSCIMSHAEFGKTVNHPGDSAPLLPRFGTLWLLAFSKTNITFEREEISDHWWNSRKYDRAADGDWENWGPYFEGDWRESLSYVQCFLYLASSSVNVSIFHSTWLDTFCTDLALHNASLKKFLRI